MSWVAVGVGAALGAWLRWGLSIFLGQLHSHIQLGTLVANLLGGYLIGLVLLQRGDYGWALAHSGLHLLGSIGCCIAGFATWRAIA